MSAFFISVERVILAITNVRFTLGQDCGHQGGRQQAGDHPEGDEGRSEGREGHPRVHRRRHQHRDDLRERRFQAVLREDRIKKRQLPNKD